MDPSDAISLLLTESNPNFILESTTKINWKSNNDLLLHLQTLGIEFHTLKSAAGFLTYRPLGQEWLLMVPMSWLQLQTEAGLAAAAVALEDERKRRLLMKVKQQTMLSVQGHQSFHDYKEHHIFGSSFAV